MVRIVRGLAIVVIGLVYVQWQIFRMSDGNYTAGWDPESRDEGVGADAGCWALSCES
jgi:hypothetical protein